MLDASVSHEHECVCRAHSFLCDCARLLNILMLSRVCSLASKSHPHSSGGPPPALLNPVMASAWCGCGPGRKGELQPSHLPLPESGGWGGWGCGSVLEGPLTRGRVCESQRQKSEGAAPSGQLVQQEVFPRLLGSLAVWEDRWVNTFSPHPCCPGS